MKNNVTIYTIAEKLGITPSMVSRAFNPNASVNEEKRKLILKTAEEYNFVPNRFASRLSMRKLRIGVVYCWKFKPVADMVIDGIKKAYSELSDYKIDLDITLVNSAEKNAGDCVEELNKYADYDGVILSGFGNVDCVSMLNEFAEKNPNIVHVQNVIEDTEYLFASVHNPEVASAMSAEFLSNCMRYSERKNVILFTGNLKSELHDLAKKSFEKSCDNFGLNLLDTVNMNDSDSCMHDILPELFRKYENKVDGIYITSGNSVPLCEYIYSNKIPVSLVTFDIHEELNKYIMNGTVSATIFQNLEKQGKNAFEKLVYYLIKNEKPDRKIYTNVEIVMKSNLELYTR